MLKKKIGKNNEEARLLESYKEKNIDELQDTISGYILKSAYKTLLSKEVKIDLVASRRTGKSSVILKDLKTIGSLYHLCTEKEGLRIEEKDRYKQSPKIRELNERLDLEIEELTEEQWTKARGKEIKTWWKIIYTKVQQEKRKEDTKEISKHVDTRCVAIQGELKHMLSSLLERSSNKVKLDRVIVENEANIVLITEENEVKNEVRNHFMKQFYKRRSNILTNITRQVEAYELIAEIDENIYKDLDKQILLQEWQEVLKDVKAKSAPGSSGISYPLIKKAGSLAQKVFLVLANKCIIDGEIPIKWKIG